MRGIFAVWKPKGPTSHDIVQKVRRATGERRVGHAGTLDPLAEGILVIAVGREATKKLSEVVAKEKEYVAKVRLGMTSTTDDEEGAKEIVRVAKKPTREEIEKVLKKFHGIVSQMPPRYSAIKIKGKEAYKYARKGQEVELKKRSIEIKEIEVLGYRFPNLKLRVITGPGVYIRSLARDVGEKLKTGGYLAALTRTRVGEFTRRTAFRLPEISKTPRTIHSRSLQRNT